MSVKGEIIKALNQLDASREAEGFSERICASDLSEFEKDAIAEQVLKAFPPALAMHDQRVTDLLTANNREVHNRRVLFRALELLGDDEDIRSRVQNAVNQAREDYGPQP